MKFITTLKIIFFNLILSFSTQIFAAPTDHFIQENKPVRHPLSFIYVDLPLNPNDVKSIELIVSLPRIKNKYGHIAFRINFFSRQAIEAGFVVENFSDQTKFDGKKRPVYVEMYKMNSDAAMARRREFKLAFAQMYLHGAEVANFVNLLNYYANNGTGQMYKLRTNNCATMAMKLIRDSLTQGRLSMTNYPEKVPTKLANAGRISKADETRVNNIFDYYKQYPFDPNNPGNLFFRDNEVFAF